MAEGRMLKKAISTSRRLADLKTDSARMLYTWIIPHLDVEGRFYANADMIKGSVIPRIKSFTEEKIEECLLDMAAVGLINLYRVDGDKYLNLRKFEDHQNIKKDREAPSKIPAPEKGIPENSRPTPDQLQSTPDKLQIESRVCTPSRARAEVKIREDKISEVNAREELSVDNPEAIAFVYLKTTIEAINEKLTPYNQRQVMMFVEANLKGKNHNAIIHCLKSLLKKLSDRKDGEEIKPRAYLEAALNGDDERGGEEGKHNAEDHEREAQEKNRPPTKAGLQVLGRIMAEIGR